MTPFTPSISKRAAFSGTAALQALATSHAERSGAGEKALDSAPGLEKPGLAIVAAVRRRPELALWMALLAIVNWPILTGGVAEAFIFDANSVQAGEWWRLFTHPFVHVSWYHLLLDGSAFLMLISSLADASWIRRTSYVVAAGAGGLLAAWWADPNIAISGLCGLSGMAHGLMAVSALEVLRAQSWRSPSAHYGALAFGVVVGKAAMEALTGRMCFDFLHFGLMGAPVCVSHAGGILGALLSWTAYALVPGSSGAKLLVTSAGSTLNPSADWTSSHR